MHRPPTIAPGDNDPANGPKALEAGLKPTIRFTESRFTARFKGGMAESLKPGIKPYATTGHRQRHAMRWGQAAKKQSPGALAAQDLMAIRPEAAVIDTAALVFGISAIQIGRRFRAAAVAAGLGDGYSGHSGRVGMAQDLSANGAQLCPS